MKQRNWKKIGLGVGLAALVFFVAGSAFAAGFGGVGEHFGEQSKGMAKGVKYGAFLLGVVFVVVGLVIAANMKKTNTQASVPFTMCVVGVCLLGLTAFISTGSETFFGTDKTSNAQSSLSLD